MKRIVVAVDGSAGSSLAVELAGDIGRATGAALLLLHVSEPIRLPRERYGALVAQIEERHAQEADAVLQDARRRAEQKGIVADIRSVTGPIAETIADVAEAERADLLVVGSRGLDGMARVLLGSISDRVVHISKVPVLVAH